MRLGVVILPEHSGAETRRIWARCEELGFDHAWTYDHLAWRDLRDGPWFGAVPTLAAAATVTHRMRLGTLVASPNFRHPVPFARDLLALDHLSDGRFTLGIGAGGTGWDATVLGQEPWPGAERAERFAEFVDLTDRLLSGSPTTFTGRFWSARDMPTEPGCVQRPRLPFAVAAAGPRALAVAARHGQAWVTVGDLSSEEPLPPAAGAALVARQVERLAAACDAVGRDPAELDRVALTGLQLADGLGSPESFRDAMGHYSAAGITDLVVHWPRAAPPYAGDEDAFSQVIATVA